MDEPYRVAIVGSGPAGLSAAARAAALGMRHVLIEKADHLSDTIYKYQKGKHVMATPSNLVLRSDFDFDAGKREAILERWDRQAAEQQVNVKLGAEVVSIEGEKGDFTIAFKDGERSAPKPWCWRSAHRAIPISCAYPGPICPMCNISSTIRASISTSTSR